MVYYISQERRYGIAGKKFHGKDTFAGFLSEVIPNIEIHHYADYLKKTVCDIFNLSKEMVEDPSLKEIKFSIPINIDFYLESLKKVYKLPNIKAHAKLANTPRELLQYIGTDYVREACPNYWTEITASRLTNIKNWVVSDLRFPDEIEKIKKLNGKTFYVIRLGYETSEDTHASETAIKPEDCDVTIGIQENDFSILRRLSNLIYRGKWDYVKAYHYPKILEGINKYKEGMSLEDVSKFLGIKHKDNSFIKFILSYYNIELRQGKVLKNNLIIKDGKQYKRCSNCQNLLTLEFYNLNSQSNDGFHCICRKCASLVNKENYSKYKNAIISAEQLFLNYQKTAKLRKKEFNLTKEFIEKLFLKNDKCYYSNLPLEWNVGDQGIVTLDRIDSSKGYTEDNVVLCRLDVNLMKRDMTIEHFNFLIKALYERLTNA
jgi:hypothetical protein